MCARVCVWVWWVGGWLGGGVGEGWASEKRVKVSLDISAVSMLEAPRTGASEQTHNPNSALLILLRVEGAAHNPKALPC